MRRLLPDLLTLGNLAFGSWAIALSYEGEWILFAGAIGGAMICDWLDGWLARHLGTDSPMGKELDALADLVSFGVAPAFALYNYLKPVLPILPYHREIRFWMVMVPFILPLLAAWRLARFNVRPLQTNRFFEGLPTPAHGAFWALWLLSAPSGVWFHPMAWFGTILAVGLLMVSQLPFLSLKSRRNLPWLLPVLLGSAGIGIIAPPPVALLTGLSLYGIFSYVAWHNR